MKNSFWLGNFLGIKIEINYTWLIVFGLVVWTLAFQYFPVVNPGLSVSTYLMISTAAAGLLFLSLLLHEISHAYIAKRNKLPIHGITLFIFGGIAHLEKEPQNPEVEFKMAIAGPICSLSLAAGCWLLIQLFSKISDFPILISILEYLLTINLLVALFNLVPGFPLDGGRILRALLWKISGDLKRATKISSNLGKGFAFMLMGLGLLLLFLGALTTGVWFIFIGFFLYEAAELSFQQLALKNSLNGIKVSEIMTKDIISVKGDLALNKLVSDYFLKFHHTIFPVVEDDTVKGMITLQKVKGVPAGEWEFKKVFDIITPNSPKFMSSGETEVLEALTQMSAAETDRLFIEENHKLVGVLTRRDIIKLFEFINNLEGGVSKCIT